MNRLAKLDSMKASGTGLQGYLKGSYADLVKLFGVPHYEQGDKTQAEWVFFDKVNKVVFTIYDYKEYRKVEKVTDWHIGGKDASALAAVSDVLREAKAFEFNVSRGY